MADRRAGACPGAPGAGAVRPLRRRSRCRGFIGSVAPVWPSNVNIGCSPMRMRRCSPPPDLSPLGGGAGLPPPSGGRAGEGGRHLARGDATRAGRPRSQAIFIAVLCDGAAWAANVNIGCWGGGVGKPGFPTSPPRRGMGKPGFPPPAGGAWPLPSSPAGAGSPAPHPAGGGWEGGRGAVCPYGIGARHGSAP